MNVTKSNNPINNYKKQTISKYSNNYNKFVSRAIHLILQVLDATNCVSTKYYIQKNWQTDSYANNFSSQIEGCLWHCSNQYLYSFTRFRRSRSAYWLWIQKCSMKGIHWDEVRLRHSFWSYKFLCGSVLFCLTTPVAGTGTVETTAVVVVAGGAGSGAVNRKLPAHLWAADEC